MKLRDCCLIASLLMAVSLSAQQNLFNIPSGDITPARQFFYQNQINFYSPTSFEMKQHFVFGLGKGWDAGINLLNVKMNAGKKGPFFDFYDQPDEMTRPLAPMLMFTVQKKISLTTKVELLAGTQHGFNVSRHSSKMRYATFNYAAVVWHPGHHLHIVAGPYFANRPYSGSSLVIGAMGGFDWQFHKRVSLMADYVLGNNYLGATVVGCNVTATPKFQLCIGALLPNGWVNTYGVVLEINALSYSVWGH